MTSKRYQRRRDRLWRKDPRCRLCGVVTVLPEDVPGGSEGKIKQTEPRMATIEHLDSRYDPHRGSTQHDPSIVRTTLLCWQCNFERHLEREARVPIGELRERANNGHRAESEGTP